MRLALLLLFAVACRGANPPNGVAVYIDLSGPWRTMWGDNPRFAAADLNDDGWQVQNVPMPFSRSQEFPSPFRWFRRSVVLPEMANNMRLALTVGSLVGNYEVYADGGMVGRTGAFELEAMKIPRPITFQFEHGTGSTLHIAIRVWRPTQTFPTAWRPEDQGPWLLTTPNSAPRNAGIAALTLARAYRSGDLMQPIVLFCIAAPVLLIWLRERSRTMLLWLFLYLLVTCVGRADLFVEVNPWAQPFGHAQAELRLLMALAPAVLFALFVCAWTGTRWLMWPVMVLALVGSLSSYDVNWRTLAPYWVIQILTIAELIAHTLRRRRDYALAAGAIAIIYTHTLSWGQIPTMSLIRQQYVVGGWFPIHLVPHPIAVVCFTFALSLIEVRRLVGDREEKVRLASEFEAARTVQRLMLPVGAKLSSQYSVEAIYRPAQEVGGDFYVVESLGDDGLLIAVGDVSGKGLKAAMLVSMIIGAIQGRRLDPPGDILSEVNRVLCGRTDGGFVTCVCLRLHSDGRFEMANAGHPAPWVDEIESDVQGGLPLGIDPTMEWNVTSGVMDANSGFMFASDGIIEAANSRGELFGFGRTAALSGRAAGEVADAASAWGQNDDITVVTVRRAEPRRTAA